MTSAIGGFSGGSWAMQRPDPAKMVDNLFSKVDTKNQGYIDKADLQSAIDQISSDSTSNTSGSTASVDDVFKKLDTDGDGKITKQEMTDSFKKLADQLDSQFNQSRMNMAMGAGQMPGMGDGADNGGLTKDQLTSMASQVGSKNSEMSSRLTNLVNNFDKADTNGDGKIGADEAMAFDKTNSTGSSTSNNTHSMEGMHRSPPPGGMPPPPAGNSGSQSDSTSSTSSTSKTYAAADTNKDGTVSFEELVAYASKSSTDSSSSTQSDTGLDSVMKMMMQLMQAYGAGQDSSQSSGISVTA
ncbi:MAG: EF-hand domain-containing protein [Burkholderiaceae bacterium]